MRFLSKNQKEQPSDVDENNVKVMVEPSQESNDQITNSNNKSGDKNSSNSNSNSNQNVDHRPQTVNSRSSTNSYQTDDQNDNSQNIQTSNVLRSRNNSIDEATNLLKNRKESTYSNQSVENEKTEDKTADEVSHKSILKDLVIKFFIAFIVLLITFIVGHYQLSFAWVLIVLVFGFVGYAHRLRTETRLLANREAHENEKKYIERVVVDLPNWVLFPDHERCDFFNKCIKQIWPYLNLYIQKFLKDRLLPDMIALLPDYMKSVRFEKIDLGTIPMRIGSIKCHTERSSRMEILLDVQIIYSGNANFKLKFMKFSAGVKDLQLYGMLRVRLYPLTENPPLVGSLSFTFLNCPKFDFNLIALANILDLPGLNNLLRNAVLEQIASHVVYPNTIVVPLSDIPMRTLKFNLPSGVIRLEIIEAKDLLAADYGILGMRKSDPYCKILVSTFNLQTQIIPNTVNPQWHFISEIAISDIEDQEIFIEVFDKDQNTADDFLGRLTLCLAEYDCTGEKSHWIKLEDTTTGSIHIRLTWLKLSSDLSKLDGQIRNIERIKLIYSNSMQTLMQSQQKASFQSELSEISFGSAFCCMVYLDCIRYLPKIDQLEPSVYVDIVLGSRRRRSMIVESNCNPVFEQNFLFLCDQFKNEPPLTFEIHDMKNKKKIGQTALKLENLVSGGRLSFDKPIHVRINQSLDCVLRVALELRVLYQSGFRAKKTAARHVDSMKMSDRIDLEDKNIIIDEPPDKSNIPSLDRMVMSTVEPFLMVYNNQTLEDETKADRANTSITATAANKNISPANSQNANGSIRRNTDRTVSHPLSQRSVSFSSSGPQLQRPQISLSFFNLNDPNYGPLKITVHRIINLPAQISPKIFYFVKIRRFPHRSKKQVATKKSFNTSSPMFGESFELVTSQEHPLTQLEFRIFKGKLCRMFKVFKISKQITRVVVDLTKISETDLTKYFDLEEIPTI